MNKEEWYEVYRIFKPDATPEEAHVSRRMDPRGACTACTWAHDQESSFMTICEYIANHRFTARQATAILAAAKLHGVERPGYHLTPEDQTRLHQVATLALLHSGRVSDADLIRLHGLGCECPPCPCKCPSCSPDEEGQAGER